MKIFATFCFIVSVSGYDETDLKFLNKFISDHDASSNFYNLIVCRQFASINLIKMLSGGFQRFVAVHMAGEALRHILDEPQTFLLSLRCWKAREILLEADRLRMFKKPYKWILMAGEGDYNANSVKKNNLTIDDSWYWNFLESLAVLVDSDLQVIERNAEGKFSVTGAYKISRERSLIKEPLAVWASQNGFDLLNTKSVARRRLNLQGVVIPSSIVTIEPDSYNHLEDLYNRHIDTTAKVSYNVVQLFEVLLNIRKSEKWGFHLNGSWTGMLGEIERGVTEIGSSSVFLQPERLAIIEYYAMVNPTRMNVTGSWYNITFRLICEPLHNPCQPQGQAYHWLRIVTLDFTTSRTLYFWNAIISANRIMVWTIFFSVKFIFLSPPLSYSKNIFLMPFDTKVWFCFVSMIVLCSLFLFGAISMETVDENEIDDEDSGEISFSEILVFNIGAICLQGTVAKTRNTPGRILTFFLYLSYMFLYISYSASIVAILQSSDLSIRTLSDLLNSPLKAGADDVAYSRYYFQEADDELRKAIYRKKIAPKGEPPHFMPLEKGIREVQKGFYAYHIELSAGYDVVQKIFNEEEKCGLQEIQNSFFKSTEPWLIMKKKSPYAEVLKIGIKRIIETGFKTRFTRRFYSNKPVCSAKGSRFVSVGIVDCQYAFMILIGGMSLSLLMMLIEMIVSKFKRRVNLRKKSKISSPEFAYLN